MRVVAEQRPHDMGCEVIPLSDGRVVYATFVARDQDAAALRRIVRAVASSGPGVSGRLANLVTTDRRFALPYGACGASRREAICWLERTIEIAVRKRRCASKP
jgi:hypothetical protein